MEGLLKVIKNFPDKKILVIGDVMLDTYVHGTAIKISPEAPVPDISIDSEINFPGGAANVASNISSLQGQVSLFGFIGEDSAGKILSDLLREKKIDFFPSYLSKTTKKTRIISQNQQIVRISNEDASKKTLSHPSLEEEIKKSDLIVLSDYAKGTISSDLMDFLKSFGKTIIADPKPQNVELYHRVNVLKMNQNEALEISGKREIYSAGKSLTERFSSDIIITRGSEGVALFGKFSAEFPASARNVSDITGAGDTFLAALGLSLASGAKLDDAVLISNYASGIAVSKKGTYSVKLNELEREILGEENKIKTFDELLEIVYDLKKNKRKIVWTNGCFDLPHQGHSRHLKASKRFGDYLIVGVNSDDSVKQVKGPNRPIMNEDARAEVISSFGCVDYVIIFPELDTTKYLSAFQPDFYVKGGEYNQETINQKEKEIVNCYGGRIVFTGDKVDSTTEVINKIKNE